MMLSSATNDASREVESLSAYLLWVGHALDDCTYASTGLKLWMVFKKASLLLVLPIVDDWRMTTTYVYVLKPYYRHVSRSSSKRVSTIATARMALSGSRCPSSPPMPQGRKTADLAESARLPPMCSGSQLSHQDDI